MRFEFGFEIKPPDHEIHHVMPTFKDHIARQGANIIEKGLASGQHVAKQGILGITPLPNGMEYKGQQVEAEHTRREVLLAMTNVVLDMITLGFEHVVVFVFDLPTPTPCAGDLRDVVGMHAMLGETAVVIELLACFGIDRGDRQPMHGQGTWATSQPDIVHITIPRDFGETAIPAACFQCFDGIVRLPQGQALIERGLGIGLADTDEVETVLSGQRTQRLMTGEVIAQQGDTVRGHLLGRFVNPTLARRPLAVLLLMTVWGHHGLRREGAHL